MRTLVLKSKTLSLRGQRQTKRKSVQVTIICNFTERNLHDLNPLFVRTPEHTHIQADYPRHNSPSCAAQQRVECMSMLSETSLPTSEQSGVTNTASSSIPDTNDNSKLKIIHSPHKKCFNSWSAQDNDRIKSGGHSLSSNPIFSLTQAHVSGVEKVSTHTLNCCSFLSFFRNGAQKQEKSGSGGGKS